MEHALPISGADSAGILLADNDGRLRYMAASNEESKLLEAYQAQSEEGPCQDAYRTGEPVMNRDLRDAADIWPHFAPLAVELGYESVHALPLRVREDSIGALNLFSPRAFSFDNERIRLVQALANLATLGVLQERNHTRTREVTEQLQGALRTRIVIEQAKGAVAQYTDSGIPGAFALLRAYALDTNERLTDVCTGVISEPALLAAVGEYAKDREALRRR